jgi:uncharacterized protein
VHASPAFYFCHVEEHTDKITELISAQQGGIVAIAAASSFDTVSKLSYLDLIKVLPFTDVRQIPMIIPWQSLSEFSLNGLIQEFVTREGTEYGPMEIPVAIKVEQIMEQLRSGEIEIVYDERTQTTTLLTTGSPTNRSD